ncbi:MAG TPA: 2-oxoglutarate dehydrogenase complex dihydrolipoyllysine-residue succinyltransferase [Cyclobacteriaceae bacterium]|mgnify:CR=1 FL=1|jgi:2-oxoglutarate dehydrogenase E2 component (dihydrolipoamide succinyltransferase)|nr:2-oxoglutarate dehydrogenase complex dihydrolipoyllysine-residue succinyltransferase [Cytophagales bacterium]HNT50513.1 2-oxoglutarate dehydrogenase complex dihydrolipoyllysine-residue succinyltransferase [Cyclobacteriaceae bacterium]HRE67781.1 2-oxoglutarate dehydrogenase complex dihydrolipoyllysine-residue succinyltransferase [Cyclobacteriaceae bacterium]HRF34526.1 2-oxoglutarate dehydrogenase complex dihydrolipoyllysine-residue succinyltransferase [Cyclobacteriaceae bacterium]
MAQVKVPTVGESITEVTIANWLKKDGDVVKMDEVIAELESDKATFELTAPQAGVLKINKAKGEVVPIGTVICEIAEGAGATPQTPKTETKTKETAAPKATGVVKEMKVPAVGESITEVTISTWLKKDGDYVKLDEVIAEVESDKATFELPAEAHGILRIVAKEKTTLPIGGLICKIEVTEGAPVSSPASTSSASTSASGSGDKTYASGHPSPAAAKILEEKGISSSQVSGTGVGGRITKEDANNAQKSSAKTESAKTTAATPPVIASGGSREKRSEKMTSLRKTIAKRLVSVKNETAMLTTFNEVDMKPVMDLRSRYKDKFKEKYGVGLGFMSFFTKAVCIALKEWPAVNAQINGDEVIYHEYCDVSIAVSTPRGLVVPVIRNAESLSFDQIEAEVVRLATKGRDGKLSIDEMQGGTFSITNGGVFGSMLSTPILNPPQSAILGMHNIVERPVVKDGQVVIRPIMYLALSYDHRIVDGRESVSFLVRVKELLEDPGRLILGV